MEKAVRSQQKRPPAGRFIAGGGFFILGLILPVFIPLILTRDFSLVIKSILTGLFALGLPELFMLIAAAILGKPGFQYLRRWLRVLFRRYGPPAEVSLFRYRIGLFLFSIPLLLVLLIPYLMESIEFLKVNLVFITLSSEFVLVISLFILGGDFWDKLRSLFQHKIKVKRGK